MDELLRPSGGPVAAALLFLLSLFLCDKLLWIADSDTVIVVSGGTQPEDFHRVASDFQTIRKLDHVIQAIEYVHVSWEGSDNKGLRGLPLKNREAWWKFESPIQGDLPRRPDEVIASQAWLDYSDLEVGDTVSLGGITLIIVGSVDAGEVVDLIGEDGEPVSVPVEFYFVPTETIPGIVEDLQDVRSFDFAFHMRVKVHPAQRIDEVVQEIDSLWEGYDFINANQPSHRELRRDAANSLIFFKVAILSTCLVALCLQVGRTGFKSSTTSICPSIPSSR